MRILIVSKFRAFLGGVESHVSDLMRGLEERGHEVQLFASEDVVATGGHVFNKNDHGKDRIKSAVALLWNENARSTLQSAVEKFRPDIIHYHSIYHQLSPSVLDIAGVPSVMTLHDYKLAAPCYTLFRNNEVCTDCVGSTFPFASLKYRCVGDSIASSALCATEHSLHLRRHVSRVYKFIVPSQFSRDVHLRAGIPAKQLTTVSWGVDATPPDPHPIPVVGTRSVAFIGRLHPTKGVRELLDAWARMDTGGLRLLIAGAGELEELVLARAAADASITYLGRLTKEQVADLRREASLVVIPSLFPETMGLSALECLLDGVPVILSNRGALADLDGPGVEMLSEVTAGEIAATLTRLFASQGTGVTSLRKQLAGRDLSHFRRSRMIDEIIGVYFECLDASADQ